MSYSCGCCSLDQGAKILLMLLLVEGVMQAMSVGSIGPLTIPSFTIGASMTLLAIYGFWGVSTLAPTKLKIMFHGLWVLLVACIGITVWRVLLADEYCKPGVCSVRNSLGVTFGAPCSIEQREHDRDACLHGHMMNAVLCASTILPTLIFGLFVIRSIHLKVVRGEPITLGP